MRRLAELEADAGLQAERIADQDNRITRLTAVNVALGRERNARRTEAGHLASGAPAEADDPAGGEAVAVARLREQLGRAEAHARAEAERRAEAETALKNMAEQIRIGAEIEAGLREEVAAFETLLGEEPGAGPASRLDLAGITLLYVGGRPRQVAQARLAIGRLGGRLLTHDGGVEDNPTLLAGLAAGADAALFPADCVSHDAVGWLKKACRERGLPLVPLRTASLASLLAAAAALAPRAPAATVSP